MESIYYNTEDKEVTIILGYGIGNHLSLSYIQEIVNSIKELFPLLTLEEMMKLRFMEVSRDSTRHKYMWYTRFSYDLSTWEQDGNYIKIPKGEGRSSNAFCISSHTKGVDGWTHESETAQQVVRRMVHD